MVLCYCSSRTVQNKKKGGAAALLVRVTHIHTHSNVEECLVGRGRGKGAGGGEYRK